VKLDQRWHVREFIYNYKLVRWEIFMTAFFIVISFPFVVLPIGIPLYFLVKRVSGGRGFYGWKRLLAWRFILRGLPFVITLPSILINQFFYYDAGKPILSTIIMAPVTFLLAILISALYLVSVPKDDKTGSGFASLLVNLGCLSLCMYLLFYGPPLS
jgi:hypothetical protein